MPTQLFEATTRKHSGVAVIDLAGDINRDSEARMSAAYAEIEDNERVILLNFEHVGFINSTGIAIIVGLLARARRDNRTLVACGLTEHYRSIFEITRLIDFMQVFPSEERAIASGAGNDP